MNSMNPLKKIIRKIFLERLRQRLHHLTQANTSKNKSRAEKT